MRLLLARLCRSVEARLEAAPDPDEIRALLRREVAPLKPAAPPSGADLATARQWAQSVRQSGVVKGSGFAADAGAMIDVLDAAGESEAGPLIERLLRHIEVKREACLAATFPPSRPEALRLLRIDVVIMFSRASVRRQDLRLLNAALKLNDWLFLKWGRNPKLRGELRTRFLSSLAEQERAAEVLL